MNIYNIFSAKYPRVAQFHEKVSQRWNDQSTVVDDSFERMSGYRYFGIIDHDEFFIPAKNKTIMQMLVSLYLKKYGSFYIFYSLLSLDMPHQLFPNP